MNLSSETDSSLNTSLTGRPVIFGEVLFDFFPDGNKVLGGAPFNVAWHLQGFDTNPLFISKISNDPLGDQVKEIMTSWGMDQKGLQTDFDHPTGQVQVQLKKGEQGQPTYDILSAQAYDFIDSQQAIDAMGDDDLALFYHGTLILRDGYSKNTLNKLLDYKKLPIFVDVNLRKPWWTIEDVAEVLQRAKWVKLNDEELKNLIQTEAAGDKLTQNSRNFIKKYSIDLLFVTLASKGAFGITPNKLSRGVQVKVKSIVDTVGAGDAFSAVALLGILKGWSVNVILERALDFATHICYFQGATVQDKDMYNVFLQNWTEEDNDSR